MGKELSPESMMVLMNGAGEGVSLFVIENLVLELKDQGNSKDEVKEILNKADVPKNIADYFLTRLF